MLIRIRSTTRSTPRHRVEIPCEVITSACDTPSLAWATDMSADGLWLDERADLDIGEDLVICFRPGIRWHARELMLFANVARISPGLREDDAGPGLGVAFTDLTGGERWALRSWLRPRPEKAPSRRRRKRSHTPAPRALSPFAQRLD